MERVNIDPDQRLSKLLEIAGDGGKVQFQDPGPQYAASFAKLYQAIIGAKRYEAERGGEIAPQREIVLKFEPIK